jgi:ABC-2 type transport system permease protein
MTVMTPEIPTTPLARLRWAAADAWTLARRGLIHWSRQPGMVLVGLLFPVMMVLMFGYLLGGGMAVPGGGDYREFLMPGMFAMTMAFGVETTFTAVSTDAARGVTDRFRSMPMASSAVVVGRSVVDMLYAAAGLAVMVACGLAVGWRWHHGIGDALLAFGLLLLLRFALIWVGVYLGLVTSGPEALMAVQILVWPLGMLSNAFVPIETMPGWLGAIAAWNPLSATGLATRQLFGNPGVEGMDHAQLMAVAWPLAIIAVFAPLSVRAYRRLSA